MQISTHTPFSSKESPIHTCPAKQSNGSAAINEHSVLIIPVVEEVEISSVDVVVEVKSNVVAELVELPLTLVVISFGVETCVDSTESPELVIKIISLQPDNPIINNVKI
jgi:hypothetical protein